MHCKIHNLMCPWHLKKKKTYRPQNFEQKFYLFVYLYFVPYSFIDSLCIAVIYFIANF